VSWLLVGVLLLAGVAMSRSRVSRRAHETVASRLTLRSDGIVAGADTIDLPADGGKAVLLLHGFGDTPQTVSYLASHLHSQGWAVRAPLLPGHGRTLDAFAASRASMWIDAARTELDQLRSRYETIAVVGQSMGGSLATIVSSETADVRVLALLAPYLSMPLRLRRAASLHYLLGAIVPFLRAGGERSIRDPAEVRRNLGYGFTTPRLISELRHVVDAARSAAPKVTAPTLVVQSRQDNRIPPEAADQAYRLFTVEDRELIWTEGNGHVISVDYGRQAIFAAVTDWLESHTSARAQTLPRTRAIERRRMS
jgi:carboxylesterase